MARVGEARQRAERMRIVQYYSHLNGHEHILVHKPHVWKDIEEVVGLVDASAHKTKVSEEKRMSGRLLYSPTSLNAAMKDALKERGWDESRTSYYVTHD